MPGLCVQHAAMAAFLAVGFNEQARSVGLAEVLEPRREEARTEIFEERQDFGSAHAQRSTPRGSV